jgi:hypothetical protein
MCGEFNDPTEPADWGSLKILTRILNFSEPVEIPENCDYTLRVTHQSGYMKVTYIKLVAINGKKRMMYFMRGKMHRSSDSGLLKYGGTAP